MSTITLLLSSNLEAFRLDVYSRHQHLFNYSRLIKPIVNSAWIYTISSRHKRRGTWLLSFVALASLAAAEPAYVGVDYGFNFKISKILIKPPFIAHVASSEGVRIDGLIELIEESIVKR